MAKPAIVTVDDDPEVSQAIARDLRRCFGADYQIVRVGSGPKALTILSDFALRERRVALIASDQRMPTMSGVEFLSQARPLAPGAKLVRVNPELTFPYRSFTPRSLASEIRRTPRTSRGPSSACVRGGFDPRR